MGSIGTPRTKVNNGGSRFPASPARMPHPLPCPACCSQRLRGNCAELEGVLTPRHPWTFHYLLSNSTDHKPLDIRALSVHPLTRPQRQRSAQKYHSKLSSYWAVILVSYSPVEALGHLKRKPSMWGTVPNLFCYSWGVGNRPPVERVQYV